MSPDGGRLNPGLDARYSVTSLNISVSKVLNFGMTDSFARVPESSSRWPRITAGSHMTTLATLGGMPLVRRSFILVSGR